MFLFLSFKLLIILCLSFFLSFFLNSYHFAFAILSFFVILYYFAFEILSLSFFFRFSVSLSSFLNFLVDINSAAVQMVSIHPLISKSPSLFSWPMRMVQNGTNLEDHSKGIFMFPSISCILAKSAYLPNFAIFFSFSLSYAGKGK